MSDTKLHELIDILKRQGIESGEESARKTIEEARTEAQEIVARAQAEAEAIVAAARRESEKQEKQLNSMLEVAAHQFVTNLKRVIEEGFLTLPFKQKVEEDLSDPEFLKKLMTRVVEAFASDSRHTDIQFILPPDAQNSLWEFAMSLTGRKFADASDGNALKLQLESESVRFGFLADCRSGHVRLDFRDDAFIQLFLKFLSPRFRNLFQSV